MCCGSVYGDEEYVEKGVWFLFESLNFFHYSDVWNDHYIDFFAFLFEILTSLVRVEIARFKFEQLFPRIIVSTLTSKFY